MSTKAKSAGTKKVNWEFPISADNFKWMGISLAVIVIGYIVMATANTTDPVKHQEIWNGPLVIIVAPIILVIGYCVLMPWAIMKGRKTTDENPTV